MSAETDVLITDRTPADIAGDTDKAYISYLDLNRVEEACRYLAGLFGVSIETKVWKMEDFRTTREMERLLRNINLLRAAYFVRPDTPPSPKKITYDSIYQANDIEQILKDLGSMYDSMISGEHRLMFKLGAKMFGNR